jgi:flagellar motor component MotA
MITNEKEFKLEYRNVFYAIMSMSSKSRREGLLALEECLDEDLLKKGDLLMTGIKLVIDGFEYKLIKKYFKNFEKSNPPESEFDKIIFRAIKEGILGIHHGEDPRRLQILLSSICPLKYKESYIDEELN